MSRTSSLADTVVRGAKPAFKPRKLFDGNGLFLFVAPSGVKSWRLKYRIYKQERQYPLAFEKYVAETFHDFMHVKAGFVKVIERTGLSWADFLEYAFELDLAK